VAAWMKAVSSRPGTARDSSRVEALTKADMDGIDNTGREENTQSIVRDGHRAARSEKMQWSEILLREPSASSLICGARKRRT
jgi:hypothetical protein